MTDYFPNQFWGLTQPSALPTAPVFLPQNKTLNSGLRGEGEERLALKISPQSNRNLEEIDMKDIKSRSSYEKYVEMAKKSHIKIYLKTRNSNLCGI